MSEEKGKISGIAALNEAAEHTGLAIVVADGSRVVAYANENSICQALNPPGGFTGACAEDCGRALDKTREAGGAVDYECHAGLQCRALPIKAGKKTIVAITGRTFLKAGNYRTATARAIAGDWKSYAPDEIFKNVILSGSPTQLDRLERKINEIDKEVFAELLKNAGEPAAKPAENPAASMPLTGAPPVDPFESSLLNFRLEDSASAAAEGRPDPFESSLVNFRLDSLPTVQAHDVADREAWRAFIPSLLKVSYKLACQRILEFLARHYGVESSLWLQREGSEFETAAASGEFEDRPVRIGITPDDKRIRAAVRDDTPIVLKEKQAGPGKKERQIQLFPVVIGGEVRNALGVAREEMGPELSSRILKFCRYVASRLEILRLREAVAERERLSRTLREFNEHLRDIDTETFWEKLTGFSAEMVGAERASLLVRGPAEKLVARAIIGAKVDLDLSMDVGERVARMVIEKGKPVLVVDTNRVSLPPTPAERKYKTTSFISYPIQIGEEGIAVLNFTDKVGGQRFNKKDLEMLDSIAPQIAVAVDRMALRDKAGEYEQLSITDPLTGLLNRRYIEERLTEEINRSGRTGEPISFMMLDVDEFKSYNDTYGHPAGDEALKLIGRILKENLRGADVAARYGGEEFSVLLPETTSEEAETIAERIRRHAEVTKFPKRKVTVSIGIASLAPDVNSVSELIAAADNALYQAKKNGRNNVHVYPGPALDTEEHVH